MSLHIAISSRAKTQIRRGDRIAAYFSCINSTILSCSDVKRYETTLIVPNDVTISSSEWPRVNPALAQTRSRQINGTQIARVASLMPHAVN